MSRVRGASTKHSISLGFAALALCFACSRSSESQGARGAPSNDAGAPSDDGGGSQGGASNGGEDNGKAGSAGLCATAECFRAITCSDHCGGAVVSVGCCGCVPPAVEQHSCASDN